MRFGKLALACLACLVFAPAAHAQLAFDTSGASALPFGDTGTVGYSFNVLTPISVFELDAYIGAGFPSATIPVGIFDSAGTLLTSTTLSTATPATTTPSANGGNYIGAPITPFTLAVGTYIIGEFGDDRTDMALDGGTIISDPAVAYGSGAVSPPGQTMLTAPTPAAPGVGIFGPSFKFTPAAVPEPGSLALLAGMSLTGAAFLRRRKQTQKAF